MEDRREQQMSEFRRRCRGAGLAVTHQREMIFRAVIESEGHPSPERIYQRVKRSIPAISLATVYNNIRTFLEAGLLREASVHHGSLLLESNLDDHHHLVCLRCKAIVDLEQDAVEPVRLRRRLPAGFQALRSRVEVLGLCPACASHSTPGILSGKTAKTH